MSLVLQGVSKVVNGQTHIHPTDLELQSGTMNVLLGPTSAGKTSLMRLMAGLDVPNTGKVIWNGEDVTGMRVQDRGVAMVYQQFINYPSMTVYNNIASPMRLLGKSKDEIDSAVRKAADLMQLTPMLDRKPLELSGGQQQRCALYAWRFDKNGEHETRMVKLSMTKLLRKKQVQLVITVMSQDSGPFFFIVVVTSTRWNDVREEWCF